MVDKQKNEGIKSVFAQYVFFMNLKAELDLSTLALVAEKFSKILKIVTMLAYILNKLFYDMFSCCRQCVR